MGIQFPSDAWIKELSRQLNASESYERAAQDWEGDFIFIIEADEVLSETAYLYMDLYRGKSPSAAQLNEPDEKEAAYVLAAPFNTWRSVIEGKLDPIQGMMTGQLKVRGNMMKIVKTPRAAVELVNCCSQIPTSFPE